MERSIEELSLQTSPMRNVAVKIVREVDKLSVYIEGQKSLYLVQGVGGWTVFEAQQLRALEGLWSDYWDAVLGTIWRWCDTHLLQCKQSSSCSESLEIILDQEVEVRARLCASMALLKAIAEKRAPARMLSTCIKSLFLICSQVPEAPTLLKHHAAIQYYHDGREHIAHHWHRLMLLFERVEEDIKSRGKVHPETRREVEESLRLAASQGPMW